LAGGDFQLVQQYSGVVAGVGGYAVCDGAEAVECRLVVSVPPVVDAARADAGHFLEADGVRGPFGGQRDPGSDHQVVEVFTELPVGPPAAAVVFAHTQNATWGRRRCHSFARAQITWTGARSGRWHGHDSSQNGFAGTQNSVPEYPDRVNPPPFICARANKRVWSWHGRR